MLYADFNSAGASAWIYWNMILDPKGGPWLISPKHNDPLSNPQQPIIVADPSTGKYYLTGVYFAMTHFSHFVTPGSFRINVVGNNIYPTVYYSAFKRAADHITVILMNDDAQSRKVKFL